ncbi:MAG: hypothetical protein PHO10_03100 [Gemmiger sp.]|nr:hypothetical protein [Gemmiger sp.]
MASAITGGVLTVDFTEAGWRTALPAVYTVTDAPAPFFTATTLPYNGGATLRSGNVGNFGQSWTQLEFAMAEPGELALNYAVSCESNYDWFSILLDGVQVVHTSGIVGWTDYTASLTAGSHSLRFDYSKDASGNGGSDAGAIGYLRIGGMAQARAKRWLVKAGQVLYDCQGTALPDSAQSLTAAVFLAYGSETPPAGGVLAAMADPMVLKWDSAGAEAMTGFGVAVTGTPLPQPLNGVVDMSAAEIGGIAGLEAVFGGGVTVEHAGQTGDWAEAVPLTDFLNTDKAALWQSSLPARQLQLRFWLHEGDWMDRFALTFLN